MSQSNPNFLFIMADQMAAQALPAYGNKFVKTPNMDALTEGGVVFDNAYCNSPLCAPSRFSLLSGRLPSRIEAFDNAPEFPSSIPTFVHYLRHMGYQTCLSGKMHFIGPDQLHGFEERVTTEIYPTDFGWTPVWESAENPIKPGEKNWPSMDAVIQSGPCLRSLNIDYDEEVEYQAVKKIYDLARMSNSNPFFLTVSFSHPHDPYLTTLEYWDRYEHNAIDMPVVPDIPVDERDPHSRRLYHACCMDKAGITDEHIRNARHAYYGMLSYVDAKIGKLLNALKDTGLAENTIVIITSDHGDMLGERGMWMKMSFFENSARVPLIVNAPGLYGARRVSQNVSLVDLFPTILQIANGGTMPDLFNPLDGQSLTNLLQGDADEWPDTVFSEYTANFTVAPILMVRQGKYKYIYSEPDPPQLFDLLADPQELENLAGRNYCGDIERTLMERITDCWNPKELKNRIIENQRSRLFIYWALKKGEKTSWDFPASSCTTKQYMTNDENWDITEKRANLFFR
jgi:choline-sulfatase